MKHLTLAICLIATPLFAQQGQPGQHFIENWDLDGDGAVTLEEATERRDGVFFTFDSNEDDYLDAEEYTYFDEARANDMEGQGDHGHGAMQRVADGMTLENNDVDSDGKVSRAEFVGKTADWVATIDRNGDGVVTTDDFGRAGN